MMYIKKYKAYFFLLTILFLMIGCSGGQTDQDKLLHTLVQDSIGYKKPYKMIMVLQDNGCIKCQFKVFDFIKENSANKEFLYLIYNNEKNIDLSDIKNTEENIVFDYKRYLYNYNIVNSSAVILLNNQKIDTILPLNDSFVLVKNMDYLKEQIK